MIVREFGTILLTGCVAVVSACTTTKPLSEAEKPLDFPAPAPSREVKPGESFGLETKDGEGANRRWQSAVRIQVSVVEAGFEKKIMTERELAFEKADFETFLQEVPGAELRAKPMVITFPGQVATIESVVEMPVPADEEADSKSVETVREGLMVSLLPAIPPGVDSETPVSELRKRGISLHVLAAINEKTGDREEEGSRYPIVHQYRIDRKLVLKPGVTTEVGRITRESTQQVNDKIPLLADIPLIGKLPLFRPKVELLLRRTTVITVRADWVDPTGP